MLLALLSLYSSSGPVRPSPPMTWTQGSAMTVQPALTPGLASLWFTYLQASITFEELSKRWRYVASASRADGTAGLLYAQLYTAEQAQDQAYTAWAQAYAKVAGAHSYAPNYGPAEGNTG
jgi:hypothetical protein